MVWQQYMNTTIMRWIFGTMMIIGTVVFLQGISYKPAVYKIDDRGNEVMVKEAQGSRLAKDATDLGHTVTRALTVGSQGSLRYIYNNGDSLFLPILAALAAAAVAMFLPDGPLEVALVAILFLMLIVAGGGAWQYNDKNVKAKEKSYFSAATFLE